MPFLAHIVREVFWWITDLTHEVFISKLGAWFAWLISLGRWFGFDCQSKLRQNPIALPI